MAQYRAEKIKARIVPGAMEKIFVAEESKETTEKILDSPTAVMEKENNEEEMQVLNPVLPELEKKILSNKKTETKREVISQPISQEKILAVSKKRKKSPKGFPLWGWIKKLLGQ